MGIDTGRLIEIAGELKDVEQREARLLAQLQNILSGQVTAPGIGRPPKQDAASPARAVAPKARRKRKAGLTDSIIALLKSSGGAFTAGDLVESLKLPRTPGKASSVSTTLGRLVKEGRVKKDKERGYRTA